MLRNLALNQKSVAKPKAITVTKDQIYPEKGLTQQNAFILLNII